MSRSLEEQFKVAQQKVNRLKTQIATKQKSEQRARRKERDHKKYVLAGDVLKVLDVEIDKVDREVLIGYLFKLSNMRDEVAEMHRITGKKILELWQEEQDRKK